MADHGANVEVPTGEHPQGPTEPLFTPLEVARQAMKACASLMPSAVGVPAVRPPEQQLPFRQYEQCLDDAGVIMGFPGAIDGVDPGKAHEQCQAFLPVTTIPEPQPTVPPLARWHGCLAERGLTAPFDPATIDLAVATKALEACEHLEPSDGTM